MSELIPVINTTNPNRRADVIFVHGINADPRTTWMTDNTTEGKRFPEESWLYWLGQDIPDVAVWTLGYSASASAWQGFTMPLEERAEDITNLLLTDLRLDRNRPIIFVTHSMGGLLVKHILRRALREDCTEPDAKSLVERTKGIIFLSTPHRGSDLANFIERLAFLLPSVNVSELKEDEPTLLELNNWFYRNFQQLNLQVKVFYEKRPTPIRNRDFFATNISKIVVDKDSANLAIRGVSVTPLDADHSSICWVKNHQFRKEDRLYSNVLRFIAEQCLQIEFLVEETARWKELHEKFQTLNTEILEMLNEVGDSSFDLTNFEKRWINEWYKMILDHTDLSKLSLSRVNNEFKQMAQLRLRNLESSANEINTIVNQGTKIEDLKANTQSMKSFLTLMLEYNGAILTELDTKLKRKIEQIKIT